jgi:transcriptional regulator with XRE-family HTH domain
MNENLLMICSRIRELREILGITTSDIARRIGIPEQTYLQYEKGELDIPISVLYEIASYLGTDMTVLLTGESPRMDKHCIVRAGKGIDVERFPGYKYSSIAFNFKDRDMEPLLVTLEPEDSLAPLVMHGGQEFNYVLEGCVRITLGKHSYDLFAGDSMYFDPRQPHGQAAVGGTAKFLTVIKES